MDWIKLPGIVYCSGHCSFWYPKCLCHCTMTWKLMLYLLDSSHKSNATSFQSKFIKEVCLQHTRIGHSPFSILKLAFSDAFRSVESFELQYEVCQLAKHCKHSFQRRMFYKQTVYCLYAVQVMVPTKMNIFQKEEKKKKKGKVSLWKRGDQKISPTWSS